MVLKSSLEDSVSDELSALLSSSLSLLSRPDAAFARSFVLDSLGCPQTDVSLLASPHALAKAGMFAVETSSTPLGSSCSNASKDATTKKERLNILVPVFASNQISCGAMICHLHGQLPGNAGLVGTSKPLNELTSGRWVRDEKTGETVVLMQSLSQDSFFPISAAVMRNTSSTLHENIFMVCDPRKFDKDNPSRSAMVGCTILEHRNCPVCGKPPVAACGCELPYVPLQHACDFGPLVQNLSAHFSDGYTGVTTYFVPRSDGRGPDGSALMSINLASAQCIRPIGSQSSEAIRNLRDSVIKIRMSAVSPTRGRLPWRADGDGNVERPVKGFCRVEVVDDGSLGLFTWSDIGEGGDSSNEARASVGIDAATRDTEAAENVPLFPSEDLFCNELSAQPIASESGLTPEAVELVDPGLTPNAVLLSPNSDTLSSDRDCGAQTVQNHCDENSAEHKALLRRMKNRAAATRSNARRRAHLKATREGLAEAKKQADLLTKKRNQLQEDNANLRRLLGAKTSYA